jgi:anti-sigma factor RsiW
MDHKLYEEWILSDEALSTGDRRALHVHLTACDRCRRLDQNWRSVRSVLHAAGTAGPAPGFSGRWTRRLESGNRQRRAVRTAVAVTAAGAAAAFAVSLFGIRMIGIAVELAAPAFQQVVVWTDRLIAVLPALIAAPAVSASIFYLIVPLAVMGFFAALGAGAIAWLKMFRIMAQFSDQYSVFSDQ